MKAAVPTWRNPTEDYGPASTPSSNACRPGEGRPGIHTLGVGPFFGCARIPAAQKAMPAAMWPATGHLPRTLPLARTSVDGLDHSRGSSPEDPRGKEQAHTGEGRAWMGEVIYRPGEERKINTRNQATLHSLQSAYVG